MRICALLAVIASVSAAATAHAQVYVTSVTAAIPDANGKVPGFDKVPGSAIENWANGVAQVVLTHGQSYNYCVSAGSAKANGTASVSFTISRKNTVIQTGVIIPPGGEPVKANDIFYVCSGYTVLPDSPGKAKLAGVVTYTPTGGGKPTDSELDTDIVLK
jgi:uncharacterized protein GlcG (DUF336 family)